MNPFTNRLNHSTQIVSPPKKLAELESLSLLGTLVSVEGKHGGLEYEDDDANGLTEFALDNTWRSQVSG
jgi:hypothetical protein